jgi:hypothetical protein
MFILQEIFEINMLGVHHNLRTKYVHKIAVNSPDPFQSRQDRRQIKR